MLYDSFDTLFNSVEQKANLNLAPSNLFKLTYNSFELFMIITELNSFIQHLKNQPGLFVSSSDSLEAIDEHFSSLLQMYDTVTRYTTALTKEGVE